MKNSRVYLVGGAVRDILLCVEPKDCDYVVVGSTPEKLLELGFQQVGAEFPVFHHPITGDEYALARTEVKDGNGYQGFNCHFSPDVTLEEDLARRDLTINAMAVEVDYEATITEGKPICIGNVIDPFNGYWDLQHKVLRHTTEAFADDPLRTLRLRRFRARYGLQWKIAPETLELCKKLHDSGELDHLTPERVWVETEKALSELYPSNYFDLLIHHSPFKEWEELWYTPQRIDHHPEVYVGYHTGMVMDYAAKMWRDPEIVFAAFCHDFGKKICYEQYGNAHGHEEAGVPLVKAFCDKWRVPNNFRNLAVMTCANHTRVHKCLGRDGNDMSRPKTIMKLFEETAALTHKDRFYKMLRVCMADNKGRLGKPYGGEYPQATYLKECLEAVISLDTKSISSKMVAEGKDGKLIGETIRSARIDAIRQVSRKWKKEMNK